LRQANERLESLIAEKQQTEAELRTALAAAERSRQALLSAVEDRQRAEELSREGQLRLQLAVEAANVGLWDWNLQTNAVYFSPEWKRQIGYSPEEIGDRFEEWQGRVHPEDLQPTLEKVRVLLEASGSRHEAEFRFRHKNGTYRWIYTQGAVIRDADGKAVRMLGSHIDITERRQAEDLLRLMAQRPSGGSAADFLTAVVRYLGSVLGVDYVLIERLKDAGTAETMAVYSRGQIVPNLEYALRGTPCANVAGKTLCHYPVNVQGLFPEDTLLREMGVESYLGIPLWDTQGQPIGLMAIMDGKPMPESRQAASYLQLAAVRVASEVQWQMQFGELQEREARYRAVVESSTDGFLLVDLEGRIAQANDAYARFSGYSLQELGHMRISDLEAKESSTETAAHIRRVVREGGDRFESRHRTKDGRIWDVEVNCSFYPIRGGHIFAFLRDITSRKRAEEALREGEERYRSLFESAAVPLWEEDFSAVKRRLLELGASTGDAVQALFETHPEEVLHCAGLVRVLDVNSRTLGFFGVESKEEVWRHLPDYFDESSLQVFGAELVALASGKQEFVGEIPIRGMEGKQRNLLITVRLAPGAETSWSRVYVSFVDISERQKAEQALRLSQQRLALHVQQTPLAVVEFDLKGRITEWNPAAEAIFGFPRQEAIGQYWHFIVPEPVWSQLDVVWESLVTQAGGSRSSNANCRKDGRIIQCEWFNTPLRGEDGTTIGVASLVMDITDRVRAEEDLRQALAEKEVLLQEIHHRVKNNLQVVAGLLELQAQRLSEPAWSEALRESQERIRSIALVHEKLYQGRSLARIGIGEYLESLVAELFRTRLSSDAVVRLNLEVAPATLELRHAAPCGLIINELVTNALKHAFPPGWPTAPRSVEVRWEEAGPNWRISVGDNGTGLPPALDWQQAPSLGLRLVRLLCRQLKGSLRHEPGPGCRFVFEFPKIDLRADEPQNY
jgi:PAS domain S-box-containing protein